MTSPDLISLRKRAEDAVADMADGPLKIKAFEIILGSLLTTPASQRDGQNPTQAATHSMQPIGGDVPSSIADRIDMLGSENFFVQPRSLGEIQSSLAEHGWHYPQANLSTPLIRLVRQRRLRRLQLSEGKKKVWKYSLP
jgi:hypothetical protein